MKAVLEQDMRGLIVSKRRRSQADVVSDILAVAMDGALKTHIMYRANLSYAQLRRYLVLLQEMGLLEARREDGLTVYTTTRKGAELLKMRSRQSIVSCETRFTKSYNIWGYLH